MAKKLYGDDYMKILKEKAQLNCLVKKEDEESMRPKINYNEKTECIEVQLVNNREGSIEHSVPIMIPLKNQVQNL